MVLRSFDLNNFIPLLRSTHDWQQIATHLESIEHQDNTHLLVEMLSRPFNELFDTSSPWKQAIVDQVLKEAGD